MIIANALHVLAAVIWVGGMFFAYMALRPAAGLLEPPLRLTLWTGVFERFFPWVWAAIMLLFTTGYWMLFSVFGGFQGSNIHIHIMHLFSVLMLLLFVYLFFMPFRRLKQRVGASDWPNAGRQLNQIRLIVATNLTLGLIVVAVAAGGRHWG